MASPPRACPHCGQPPAHTIGTLLNFCRAHQHQAARELEALEARHPVRTTAADAKARLVCKWTTWADALEQLIKGATDATD